MLMTLIGAFMGAIASLLITVCCNLFSGIADIWIPVLLFLACTVGSLALIIIICFIITVPINVNKPLKKPSKFYFFLYNMVNSFLVLWSGAKVEITGKELLTESDYQGPYFFVLNHRSRFDTMILSKYFKKYTPMMVSKPSNFKIPIAGGAIYKSGFLSVPREDNRVAIKMINDAVAYLKSGKYSIGICPEGTRNQHGRYLLPFRNGCFKIAVRAKVPTVVISVEGSQNISKNFPFKRTKVHFDILKVIQPEEYEGKQTVEIGNEVRALMYEKLNSYEPITEPEETV